MIEIRTDRLCIKPTHKNCWSIFDQQNQQMIGKLFFRNQWFNILLKPQSLRLGVATEASYGLMKAINSDTYKAQSDLPHAQQFLMDLGFKRHNGHFEVAAKNLTFPNLYQTINAKLGIHSDSITQPHHQTATQLVDSDIDCYGRPTKLHPAAANAWQLMRDAAQADGIEIALISAYRSLSYQADLILKKINQGQNLPDILKVNAAPGHSEHHTGCAVDIGTPNHSPLETDFDQSRAFSWLSQHAATFDFVLTYPKNNHHGISYEPWHWCYQRPTNNAD